MKNATPAEVIQWFKDKAAEFTRIAETLEATFPSGGQLKAVSEVVGRGNNVPVVAVENALMELGKPARYSTIAKHMGADPSAVWGVLKGNPTLFDQVGRGWWKRK